MHSRYFREFTLGCDIPGPNPPTYIREKPKTRRNDPCPCGSGKKYKKCCADKHNEGTENN